MPVMRQTKRQSAPKLPKRHHSAFFDRIEDQTLRHDKNDPGYEDDRDRKGDPVMPSDQVERDEEYQSMQTGPANGNQCKSRERLRVRSFASERDIEVAEIGYDERDQKPQQRRDQGGNLVAFDQDPKNTSMRRGRYKADQAEPNALQNNTRTISHRGSHQSQAFPQ